MLAEISQMRGVNKNKENNRMWKNKKKINI